MSKRRMGERKMRINPKRCIPSSWPGSTRPSTSSSHRLDKEDVDARHRRQVYAVCAKQTAMAGPDEGNDGFERGAISGTQAEAEPSALQEFSGPVEWTKRKAGLRE